jgi:hypothetical protein
LLSSDAGKKLEYNETVHQQFIYFEKAYDLVSREILYSIFIGFRVSMELVTLIKMRLYQTYSEVRIGKYLTIFLSKMVLKKEELFKGC